MRYFYFVTELHCNSNHLKNLNDVPSWAKDFLYVFVLYSDKLQESPHSQRLSNVQAGGNKCCEQGGIAGTHAT